MFGVGIPELVILLPFLVIAFVGALIAKRKGRLFVGWFISILFLPILIVFPVFLKPAGPVEGKYKQCPSCMEIVLWDANVCKHCGNEDFLPSESAQWRDNR